MSDFRNELLGRMIRIYGFEDQLVIDFARACERYTWDEVSAMWDSCLKSIVECHEAHPYFSDEDEDEN